MGWPFCIEMPESRDLKEVRSEPCRCLGRNILDRRNSMDEIPAIGACLASSRGGRCSQSGWETKEDSGNIE